jgi:AAT family amino acid transporter
MFVSDCHFGQPLHRTMSSRHIMMMALGGAIGAGLFKGSSTAIDEAGHALSQKVFIT